MAVARARLGPRGLAFGPALLRRIPFPGVLHGGAIHISLILLHSAEQDRAAALAIPNHRRVVSGTGCGSWRKLSPRTRGGIPLPAISKRQRDAYSVVVGAGETTAKEQHLAGGFFEHHAVLAATDRHRAGASAIGEGAGGGIPFPCVSEIVVGNRTPTEDDKLVPDRIENHARAKARERLASCRGAVRPCASRGIPFPHILKRREVHAGHSAEHDQELPGIVKGGRLQVARGRTWRGRNVDAGPSCRFGCRHRAQGRMRGLKPGLVAGRGFGAGCEQEQRRHGTHLQLTPTQSPPEKDDAEQSEGQPGRAWGGPPQITVTARVAQSRSAARIGRT